MKDPKALFPFLFASSWLGDLLLTILAFFLAFTHDGPLTPLVFATVGLCILAGNLLPIGSYLIFTRWRAEELRAEQAEATVRVRDALRRSEEVMARLDEADGSLSKTILIARQVPERIAESLHSIEDLSGKLNTLEAATFTELLEGNSSKLEALQKDSHSVQQTIDALKGELGDVPASIGKLMKSSLAQSKKTKTDENDVSLGERLDMVFESLETVQDSLDGLLNRIAELPTAAPEVPVAVPSEESGPDIAGPKPEAEPERVEVIEEEEDGQIIEEPEAEEQIEPEPEPEPVASEQEEMTLGETEAGEDHGAIAPDVVQLSAHAMVGISNKIYIRGDEPWLSWDEGQQMELIGIGEFAWSTDNLKEPIEVALFLNDEIPAEGGNILLEPGKPVDVQPKFPKS
ncbi:hypothetical protein G0Q06_02920 [Puniceicoccales bacterium CK1056]|uniref:Uncharacterized protein n=1 Tax=Oceanipulchritudo coccoides TaxID=2706888 RepID=A0A6B2LXQ8_9BACT|nr:hypothetical protein [Oceanipulchritudo coccoides]NDV61398.1 hypothetical protein [Oceanipulchritudo coccoides]